MRNNRHSPREKLFKGWEKKLIVAAAIQDRWALKQYGIVIRNVDKKPSTKYTSSYKCYYMGRISYY